MTDFNNIPDDKGLVELFAFQAEQAINFDLRMEQAGLECRRVEDILPGSIFDPVRIENLPTTDSEDNLK